MFVSVIVVVIVFVVEEGFVCSVFSRVEVGDDGGLN